MLKNTLYIFSLLLMLFISQQELFSATICQEPEAHHVFDSNFKDRYSGRKFDYEGKKTVHRTKPGSGKYEDYKNDKIKLREQNNSGEYFINLGPLGWLFYLILFIAVVFLAYVFLNEGGTGLFASNRNKAIQSHDNITAENIEHTDIKSLIKEAENDKNFRLAIRYYYLLVLKTLNLKNHIRFEDDKTNSEYLNELSEKPFSKAFSYASYLYSYIWYGKFPLDGSQYAKAKRNFTSLLKQVK